jgi:S1-C subfamily serine protease
MRTGALLGTAAAFLAGMATAIMTGNALVRMRQEARANTEREQISSAAVAAQAWLDKDDFLDRLNESNRHIAAAVEPSVVHLAVATQITQRVGGRPFNRMLPSTGSGWVYDDAGHIVTNNHVAAGASADREDTRIFVHFADGRAFPAKVIGSDESTDIAVLEVDHSAPLIAARRASDDPAQQGDRVYAFGSPFGFRFSMSQGIVSALSRDPSDGPSGGSLTNYIQTDAAINPGNSGGPLCDIRGRVIGMNVAIVTDGGGPAGSRGVGFAIPLSTIEPIVEQIIAHGEVSRGFVGVSFPQTDDLNTAALRGSDFNGTGVIVNGIVFGAPAEAAGLKVGDIIVGVNGQSVRGVAHFRTLVATRRPGDVVAIKLWREGKNSDTTLTLVDYDEAMRVQSAAAEALSRFGIEVSASRPITIVRVTRPSRAAEMGFQRGDQITAIDNRAIRTYEDLVAALAFAKFQEGQPVQMSSARAGEERKLTIQTDAAPDAK